MTLAVPEIWNCLESRVDYRRYRVDEIARAVIPLFHALVFFSEETRVNGFTLFSDAGGMSMKQIVWLGAERVKQQAQFTSIRCHNTMVSIYDCVDMSILPEEYLPDDYDGPSAGSLDSIIERNIQDYFIHPERREFFKDLYSGQYFADPDKIPAVWETMASFRKLNVS